MAEFRLSRFRREGPVRPPDGPLFLAAAAAPCVVPRKTAGFCGSSYEIVTASWFLPSPPLLMLLLFLLLSLPFLSFSFKL